MTLSRAGHPHAKCTPFSFVNSLIPALRRACSVVHWGDGSVATGTECQATGVQVGRERLPHWEALNPPSLGMPARPQAR